jgi:hypothetical protein
MRDMARIRQHAQAPVAVRKDELNRLTGIVWHGKGCTEMSPMENESWLSISVTARLRPFPRWQYLASADRPSESTRTGSDATDVIGMLMCDEYRVDVCRLESQPRQAS